MFWGLTPALDLVTVYKNCLGEKALPEEINVLLVGGADCRHILQTIAKRYRHKQVKLNFYVVELCMETVGKQLLLLLTALQPTHSIGLDQKTKVFMELYGNTLIRPYTSKYLASTASDMVKMITNYDKLHEIIPYVHFDIKYKERDYLENLLKFWCGKDEYNIMDIWDRRLRNSLGVRYDSKIGAFDWDLHMRFHKVGGKRVCDQEYRTFRSNGVAFSWIECEVSKPNRSMVCAILPNGESFAHYGYLGDMETGPFVAYGLDCEDETFLKCTNGQNAHRATDIIERNLKQIFYEIENGKEYEHRKKHDMELGYAVIKQDKLVIDTRAQHVINNKTMKNCLKVDGVTINFVSASLLEKLRYKEKFEKFFDIVYFANNYLKQFDKDGVQKALKSNSLLLIEHQLFVLNKRNIDLEKYVKEVKEKLEGIGLVELEFCPDKDAYLKYIVKCE